MTIFDPARGQWATAAAPPTLEAMIFAAAEQADLNMPFDEFLVADPYAVITRDLEQAVQFAPSKIGGRKVEHVLMVGRDMQLEYWIDPATSLPLKGVVVYTDHPNRPHFTVEFSDWRMDQKLAASVFALPKPAGAKQVELREAAAAFR
jgi:hypothetical protein